MPVHKFNIVRAKPYQDKQGNQKTQWLQVGVMTVFEKQDGSTSRIIEMNDRAEVYQLFPFQEKSQERKQQENQEIYREAHNNRQPENYPPAYNTTQGPDGDYPLDQVKF